MKRVYAAVDVRPVDRGWSVALDGKPMRTPGKNELILPSQALAAAIAAEWDSQRDEIRPATMPLTRLAATAIDRTAAQRDLIDAEATTRRCNIAADIAAAARFIALLSAQ